jgi:hypothetical protein
MKKASPKLTVHRETLRRLANSVLPSAGAAVGGGTLGDSLHQICPEPPPTWFC